MRDAHAPWGKVKFGAQKLFEKVKWFNRNTGDWRSRHFISFIDSSSRLSSHYLSIESPHRKCRGLTTKCSAMMVVMLRTEPSYKSRIASFMVSIPTFIPKLSPICHINSIYIIIMVKVQPDKHPYHHQFIYITQLSCIKPSFPCTSARPFSFTRLTLHRFYVAQIAQHQ